MTNHETNRQQNQLTKPENQKNNRIKMTKQKPQEQKNYLTKPKNKRKTGPNDQARNKQNNRANWPSKKTNRIKGSLLCILLALQSSWCGRETGCFTLFDVLVSCECYSSVVLPHGVVGLSAAYDSGISVPGHTNFLYFKWLSKKTNRMAEPTDQTRKLT